MIVAEIQLSEGGFGGESLLHTVMFDDVEKAKLEYERVAALMLSRADRKNDLPKMLEVQGSGNKISLPLDHIRSVAMLDFAWADKERSGVRDAFPNLFKK